MQHVRCTSGSFLLLTSLHSDTPRNLPLTRPPGSLDDRTAVGNWIDALIVKFAALREAIDKAIADARKDQPRGEKEQHCQ